MLIKTCSRDASASEGVYMVLQVHLRPDPGESYVSPDNSDFNLKSCVTNDRGYPSICHGGVIKEISGTEVFSTASGPGPG